MARKLKYERRGRKPAAVPLVGDQGITLRPLSGDRWEVLKVRYVDNGNRNAAAFVEGGAVVYLDCVGLASLERTVRTLLRRHAAICANSHPKR